MRKLQIKLVGLLTVLVLLATLITGCVHGPDTLNNEIKANPSAEYLYELAHEHNTKTCGPAHEAVLNDWIAQNEPDYSKTKQPAF